MNRTGVVVESGIKPPKWDFGGMEHTCWLCQNTFVGVNRMFLPQIGEFIKCNICQNCWLNCKALCITAQLHAFNYKKAAFNQIFSRINFFKAILDGEVMIN